MFSKDSQSGQMADLLATPDLADALESEQFKRFLDQIPIAIIVSELKGQERVIYANPEFEKLCRQTAAEVWGKPWSILDKHRDDEDLDRGLGAALVETNDYVGVFRIECTEGDQVLADAYSNIIQNDEGVPLFRLVALVNITTHGKAERAALKEKIREKDTLLKEVQHRVKNNLQMITALIRLEARNGQGDITSERYNRLAGRIEALQFLYDALSPDPNADEIDLGVYLSQIASGVMRSYAGEGIRLDLKVDAYPVSVNVAMPTGLVVNELLTNALKHAFADREGGTITLHSTADSKGCQVVIADDGVGLPTGVEWPKQGKLSTLVVKSLRENAKAALKVELTPGKGMRVTISFTRAAAAPEG